MSHYKLQQLFNEPIGGHAFSKDLQQIVVSNSTPKTHIMKRDAEGKYNESVVLGEHLERVTSVDWAPNSNRIVTCAGDRNAYVWEYNTAEGVWKPCLVLLRINRAATFVRWSPREDKFAVGSGSRILSVCYFEKDNNWWVSKHIKKPIRSTVLCVDWHPNNYELACGSSDFKCRVFSAFIKEVEEKPTESIWSGKKQPFANLACEVATPGCGWVHGVKFSPSGNLLAFVAHDSSINIIVPGTEPTLITISTTFLPYSCVLWLTEESLIAAGHSLSPDLYKFNNGKLTFARKLGQAPPKPSPDDGEGEDDGLSAMERFRNLDSRGSASGGAGKSGDTTTHVNCITEMRAIAGPPDNVATFSTSGRDGRLVIWDVKSIEKEMAGLKI